MPIREEGYKVKGAKGNASPNTIDRCKKCDDVKAFVDGKCVTCGSKP